MRLQTIVSRPPVAGTEALCQRRLSDGTLSFDTYFGAFPAALWKKRTRAHDFSLRLCINGAGIAKLIADGSELASRETGSGEIEIRFDPGDAEMIWLTLESGMNLEYGIFEGIVDAPRDIRLAVNICTYRREGFVRRNIALLKGESPLSGRLRVYVTDNADTLGDIDGARVFPNINAGGSGGFARGLMEIADEGWATHAVFMDDDVTIFPEALERLYALLASERDEYFNRPVGGAMLRLDAPHWQHESLALWRGLLSDSLATGLNLTEFENVRAAAKETDADYSAWWFSCVPMNLVRAKGLPLPLFMRMDDIEYGLRLGEKPIAIPGICVWHEAFERKHSAKTEYYHARNALIVDALRTPEMPAVRLIRNLVLGHALRFRYIHAEMALKGVEDYLKGPEYIARTDPDANNRALENVEILTLDRLPESGGAGYGPPDTRLSRLICAVTLNGVFLPTWKNAKVFAHKNSVRTHLCKKGAVNVIEGTGTGFYVKRDIRRAIGVLRKLFRLESELKRRNEAVAALWRENESYLTSREFWLGYLKMGGNARK